jgi:hypothetical protein
MDPEFPLANPPAFAGVDTVVIERHRQRPGFCRGFNLNADSKSLAREWKRPAAQ